MCLVFVIIILGVSNTVGSGPGLGAISGAGSGAGPRVGVLFRFFLIVNVLL